MFSLKCINKMLLVALFICRSKNSILILSDSHILRYMRILITYHLIKPWQYKSHYYTDKIELKKESREKKNPVVVFGVP